MAILISCPTCDGKLKVRPIDVRKEAIMVCVQGHLIQLRNVIETAAVPDAVPAATA